MKRRASRWAVWRPSLRELAIAVALFAVFNALELDAFRPRTPAPVAPGLTKTPTLIACRMVTPIGLLWLNLEFLLIFVLPGFALWRFIRAAFRGLRRDREVWRAAGLADPEE